MEILQEDQSQDDNEHIDFDASHEIQMNQYKLSKQNKEKLRSDASVASRISSLNSERKQLDQIPREARLNNRIGSPLGMTIEELDDRGFLDGGASVPSYYTSIKQRSRRQMEMKKRSSRLKNRISNDEVSRKIFVICKDYYLN